MPSVRLSEPHHHAHHSRGRVELAALLAGRVGEVADQVLVGGAEQVGELEVLLRSGYLVKCMMSSRSFLSGIVDWPTLRLKSMCCSTPSSDRFACLERGERLVEAVADVLVQLVAEVFPARPLGDEERLVEGRRLGALLRLCLGAPLGELVGDDLSLLRLEHVRGASGTACRRCIP